MRTSGKLALGLVLSPVVIGAAAVIFVLTFDWNRAKPYLNDHVSQAIGRAFAINGDLMLTWKKPEGETGWRAYVPWPRLIANDITVGNPDWTKQRRTATTGRSTSLAATITSHLTGSWNCARLPSARARWRWMTTSSAST
jgi:uncharacterized protein involved in outer membrane biogenesis